MKTIGFEDFHSVELRTGTIIDVQEFPEAKNPAYKLQVDFWSEIGIKKTSAQITDYTKETLIGKQVIGVVNFPPKQIWKFMSEFLLTAFIWKDGKTTLAVPDKMIENGEKLV